MLFRLHRMKEPAREHFRWAAHTSGLAIAKPKDYEPSEQIEAASAYAAWANLRTTAVPLETGDILEAEDGTLSIAKYVGFEGARWWEPEPKQGVVFAPESAGNVATHETVLQQSE